MNQLDDNTLMLQVREGDLNKLGLLYERYKKVLFAFYYHQNRNAQVSEDLVQNVFYRVLKYRHGFRGDGVFKVWLFHIARNVSADHYRKNKRANLEDIDGWQDKLSHGDGEAHQEMEKRESRELLHLAIQNMETDKREVLILSKIKELKYKEIGEIIGCTEGAVKVKVFRALKALRSSYLALQK